jgi:hypothetical protein
MEEFSIERAGVANLDFTGELIGQSTGPTPRTKIYRTKGGKYVGETNANLKMAQAQHFDAPTIMDAAKHDDGFKAAWNEHVD